MLVVVVVVVVVANRTSHCRVFSFSLVWGIGRFCWFVDLAASTSASTFASASVAGWAKCPQGEGRACFQTNNAAKSVARQTMTTQAAPFTSLPALN